MIVASHIIVFLIAAFASRLPFSFASNVSKGKGPTEDVRYVSEQPHLLEALVELEEALAEVKDEERVSQNYCIEDWHECDYINSGPRCCSEKCDGCREKCVGDRWYPVCEPKNIPRREIGEVCAEDDDCHSHNCGNGKCRQNEDYELCLANKDCLSGKCESWMNSYWKGCVPKDKECDKDSDCPSRMCRNWKCWKKYPGMMTCYHDDNCISGKCYEIINVKQCEKTKAGTSCNGDANCLSNKCENNICA